MSSDACPSVFITGASSGIGEALALEFARRGYRLALAARRGEALQDLRDRIGSDAQLQCLDVRDPDAVKEALQTAFDALGGLDIVMANAGVGTMRALGQGDFQDDLDTFATNISGACATLDAALRLMRQQGHGQLVAITSVARYRGLPRAGAYGASKAALHLYVESLRNETATENIHVCELAPGYIDTPMNRGAKSRPFVIPVERGARIMVDLIEKRRSYSTVPVWPWSLLARLLAILPGRIVSRM